MQCLQVAKAQLRCQESRVPAEIRPPHGGQVEGEGHAADQAHGTRESFPVRSGEERAVGRSEDRPLVTELLIGKVGVHTLVDGEHHGRHGHVDVLAPAGTPSFGQAGQDRDGRVQARVDVGVGQ